MELKFKEVDEELYSVKASSTNKDLRLKPFYTVQEMATIYNAMIGTEEEVIKDKKTEVVFTQADSFDEYFTKVVLSTNYCTNLDLTSMENEDIFNLSMQLKLDKVFNTYISQYATLDDMMKREKSMERVVDEFLGKVEGMVENIDTKNLIEKFKDVIEKGLKNNKLAEKKAK